MRELPYILLFLMLSGYQLAHAQNLVPNPSFEIYSSCPAQPFQQIDLAVPWFQPRPQIANSSDFFHSCSGNTVGTPVNALGYQYPRTGDGYAGIATFMSSFPETREYIEVKLLDTLQQGRIYCVSFYISLADKSIFAGDQIGIYFSGDSVLDNTTSVLPYIPQVFNFSGNILNDTANWVQISATYIALGGEQFITLGSFSNDANTSIDTIDTTWSGETAAYYYIDDVYVGSCDTGSVPNDTLIIPNVFTPNADGINDLFTIQSEGIENISCIIFNRWGIKVAEFNQPGQGWDGKTTSGQDAVEGVYYYIVNAKSRGGETITRKGFIHLLR